MTRSFAHGLVLAFVVAGAATAQEYRVEKIESPAPADEISPEIAALLAPTGLKLVKGESRTVCEIWPAKEWPIKPDAKTTSDVLYPLTPGQLIGVVNYARKGADFRDQEIPKGVYTLRYGQQPVDGAHVGTSPTRDFLLLLPAAGDRDPKVLEYKPLTAASKETSGTAHPAILSLVKAGESGEPLAVVENADKEWTIVRFMGKTRQDGQTADLPVELVVVGVAAE